MATSNFNPFRSISNPVRPPTRWEHLKEWLEKMDRKFFWRRVIIVYNDACFSRAMMAQLGGRNTRMHVIAVRGSAMSAAFMIYDVDHLPRMQLKQLRDLLNAEMERERVANQNQSA